MTSTTRRTSTTRSFPFCLALSSSKASAISLLCSMRARSGPGSSVALVVEEGDRSEFYEAKSHLDAVAVTEALAGSNLPFHREEEGS